MANFLNGSDPASRLIQIAASNPTIELDVTGEDFRLHLDHAALARLLPTAHLYLRLEGLRGNQDATVLSAVLKGAGAEARDRLGLEIVGDGVNLYGLRRATAEGHGKTVQLNVTSQAAWLRRAAEMGYDEVAVEIKLARPLPPGERLSVARVSICTDL
jgi:hypothetical protein